MHFNCEIQFRNPFQTVGLHPKTPIANPRKKTHNFRIIEVNVLLSPPPGSFFWTKTKLWAARLLAAWDKKSLSEPPAARGPGRII